MKVYETVTVKDDEGATYIGTIIYIKPDPDGDIIVELVLSPNLKINVKKD